MNNRSGSNDMGFKISRILGLYFALYFGAILLTNILLWRFDMIGFLYSLIYFPMGFNFIIRGEEGIAVAVGYFVYLTALVLLLVFRKKKEIVIGVFAVFIFFLILNIHGCLSL